MRAGRRLGLACGAVVFSMAHPVLAQAPAPDVTRLLAEGMKIRISDDQGRVAKGRVEGVSAAAINLRSGDETSQVPVSGIWKIEQEDGLGNGALIGLGLGAVIGMVNGATDRQGDGHRGRFFAAATAVGAGVWMGIGALIDATHRNVIYRREETTVRVVPLLKRNTWAIALMLDSRPHLAARR